MKRTTSILRWPLLALAGLAVACSLQPDSPEAIVAPVLPDTPYEYAITNLPSTISGGMVNGGAVINHNGFIEPNGGAGNTFELSNITDAGATLGRVLFYDRQLSVNNTVSCGTCHKQEFAFADGKKGSEGFGGKTTPRNTMAIVNVAMNNNLFWDSRLSSLRVMVAEPVQNHVEMGMESMQALAQKLAKSDFYAPLFEAAFGSPQVDEQRISSALTQFLSSMVTAKSKFDYGMDNQFAQFSELEKVGQALFFSERTQCSSCHSGPNFSAPDLPGDPYGSPTVRGTANIGLDINYRDNGKGDGQFKIPSLRNIALTAPYMHDGRFNTLEEVVEHYNSGVQPHRKLDSKFIGSDGNPKRLGLDIMEKQALVAFLKTLTDESLVQDVRFSDPFQR